MKAYSGWKEGRTILAAADQKDHESQQQFCWRLWYLQLVTPFDSDFFFSFFGRAHPP